MAQTYKKILFYIPLVSREWRDGSNSSYNCTPFLHSLLTKGKEGVNTGSRVPLKGSLKCFRVLGV